MVVEDSQAARLPSRSIWSKGSRPNMWSCPYNAPITWRTKLPVNTNATDTTRMAMSRFGRTARRMLVIGHPQRTKVGG